MYKELTNQKAKDWCIFIFILLIRRRRDNLNWSDTAVKLVFSHQDAAHLIRMHDLALQIRVAIVKKHKTMLAAFRAFDVTGNQMLTHQELRSAIKSLIDLPTATVSEIVAHADSDNNGVLSYREFVSQFSVGESQLSEIGSNDDDLRRRVLSFADTSAVTPRKVQPITRRPRRNAAEQTLPSATTSRKGKRNALLTIAELPSLGRLVLVGGGRVTQRDGVVATSPGHRPTVAPRGVLLKQPGTRWYFEVEVVTAGLACIGVYDSGYTGDSASASGVGDDAHSWGFSGCAKGSDGRGAIRHDKDVKAWGYPWNAGDVVGCLVTIESDSRASISFSLNGSWNAPMGAAFQSIVFEDALVPAVSFDRCFQYRFNSGKQRFRYVPPPQSRSVDYFVRRIMSMSVAAAGSGGFGQMKTTTGTSNMTIKQGACPILTVGEQGFPTCLLQGCLLTQGKWYYEFTLRVKSTGWGAVSQIGWADVSFIGSSRYGHGIGDDKHSWGFDGHRKCMWYNCVQQPWGKNFKTRDVVGCAADIDERRLRFSLNGSFASPMGVAVENIEITGGLTPGYTIKSCEVEVNLGFKPFANTPPPGYLPVACWLQRHCPANVKLPSIPASVLPTASDAVPDALSAPPLEKTISMRTRPIDSLKRISMRATSGPFAILNDREANVLGATGNYPSAVLDRLPLLTSGVWFFEAYVRKIPSESETRDLTIGWATRKFYGDSGSMKGVGDDSHSVGLTLRTNSTAQLKLAGINVELSYKIDKKEVCVGAMIDMDTKTLRFFAQGQALKLHDGAERVTLTSVDLSGLRPAVSLMKGFEVQVNLGDTPFRHPPTDVPFASPHDLLLHIQSGKTGLPEPRVPAKKKTDASTVKSSPAASKSNERDDTAADNLPLTAFFDIRSLEEATRSLSEQNGSDPQMRALLTRLEGVIAEVRTRVSEIHGPDAEK
eukprot:g700.t1